MDEKSSTLAASYAKTHAANQGGLADLLQADLELCFAVLATARLTSSPRHHESSMQIVREGVDTIRTLADRIEDFNFRAIVHDAVDELERALESSLQDGIERLARP